MIFDYQPGDELQYEENSFFTNGPPWLNYHRFRKHIFLTRIDLPDTIRYSVSQTLFYPDSNTMFQDTIQLIYVRYDTIGKLPFEFFDGKSKIFSYENYCGQYLPTYNIFEPNSFIYCDSDNCWGYFDTQGPPEQFTTIYTFGIGTYLYQLPWTLIINPNFGSKQFTNKIIYFLKNGISCGTEQVMGISNAYHENQQLTIYQNPIGKSVSIKSTQAIKKVSIIDLTGRVLCCKKCNEKEQTISIENFHSGIYIISSALYNGFAYNSKLIIK